MNKPLKSISDDAMRLTPEDRLRLVDQVLESLTPSSVVIDYDWAQEIADRVTAFEQDQNNADDADDVLSEARRALRS